MKKNSIIKDGLNWFIAQDSKIKGNHRRFVWLVSILLLGGCSGIRTMNGMGAKKLLSSNLSDEQGKGLSDFEDEMIQQRKREEEEKKNKDKSNASSANKGVLSCYGISDNQIYRGVATVLGVGLPQLMSISWFASLMSSVGVGGGLLGVV